MALSLAYFFLFVSLEVHANHESSRELIVTKSLELIELVKAQEIRLQSTVKGLSVFSSVDLISSFERVNSEERLSLC